MKEVQLHATPAASLTSSSIGLMLLPPVVRWSDPLSSGVWPSAPDLLRRVANGDRDAFELLVEGFSPLVWSVCAANGLAPIDREDVVQGVWLIVVQHVATLREPEKFAGWLATITRNECAAFIRRAVRTRASNAASIHETTVAGVDGSVLERERAQAVRTALSTLDARCRELLTMLSVSPPVPYTEISQTLNLPVSSIGPTRARCLDKLRRSPSILSIMEH